MRWTSVVVAVVLGGAACNGQPESPSANLSVGSAGASFSLSAVGGQPLPANAYFGVDVSVAAQRGSLALAPDHSYTLTIAYDRHFASGNRDVPFTQAEQGGWSASGSDVTLTPAGGAPRKATLSGSELSFDLTVEDSPPPERATKSYTFQRTP